MKKSKIYLLALTIAGIVLLAIFLASKGKLENRSLSQNNPTPSALSKTTKTFKSSSVLDFTIEVPVYYKIEEKSGQVLIQSGKDIIYLTKNGTNFSNLADYVNDLDVKNRAFLENRKKLTVNGLDSIMGNIGSQKIYFIFVPNRVYTIFTNDKSSYQILDLIVQSFRYTP